MMHVDDLLLIEPAQSVARECAWLFPCCEFTSGRRSLSDQARAMASNVALNRQWIAQTYKLTVASAACQAWVNASPSVTAPVLIAAGLLDVLLRLPEDERDRMSLHLAGRAFDVHPVDGLGGEPMRVWLKQQALAHGGKFLEREGGLIRWHWQA